MNTVKWVRNAGGAEAPMNQNKAEPTRNTIAVDLAEAGALAAPWPWAFAGTAAAAPDLAAVAAGDGGSFGAGGGHVMPPSLMTVRPRMASSSMLTSMRPSFFLHS